ncbi:glycosyltransferase [Candidatus Saccharibacteria bacterium]|nr:glycosyltransferase [Candidatus Saccharibacteria bacterium]
MVKNYSTAEIEELIKENKKLRIENESMKKILDSKRFRAAEKIADTMNAVLPEGTKRRKALKAVAKPLGGIARNKSGRLTSKINVATANKKKIIVIHSIVWNAPLKQRPHHLAKNLAKNKDVVVIYFEPSERLRSFRKISNNLFTTNSWNVIYNLRINSDQDAYFFFNNVSDVALNKIEKIQEHGYKIVYEYIDEFHEDVSGSLVYQLETWEKLPKLKPYLVLASAGKLYDEAKAHFTDSKVIMSKNAVNVEDFDYHTKRAVPSDLNKIIKNKKPIVGYYGALALWLDYDLISEVAKNNKDVNFVLLGVNYQNALSKLDQSIDNIYYLGPKKYKELANYSACFDVAIIPFKTGEIAKGTSPVKLFEYMAMGLPTVGTKDLNECKGYEYVYLAKDSKDFSKLINKAIEEHKDKKVREALLEQAKDNSWQSRAEDIISNL